MQSSLAFYLFFPLMSTYSSQTPLICGEDNIIVDLKQSVKIWSGFVWFRIGSSCEHGNGPLDSIKDEKFLDYLNRY
jgi:hypothetical protein